MSDIVIFLTSGSTWTVPADCQSAKIEIIAPGGGGGKSGSSNRASGGGGGAYSCTDDLPLTPGATVYTNIPGAQSQNTDGPAAWLNKSANSAPSSTADGCLAAGGKMGLSPGPTTGGLGGQASDCIGDTKFSGGNGGTSSGSVSSGGGGAASSDGAGNSASAQTGGAGAGAFGGSAGAPNGGNGGNGGAWRTQTSDSATAGPGGGGAGSNSNTNGGAGGNYGGGGAGARGSFNGGDSGGAIIVITYTPFVPAGFSRGYIIA